MDTHDIQPGQFAEEMRQLADVFVEGGANQFDADIMHFAEKVARDGCDGDNYYTHAYTDDDVEDLADRSRLV